MAAFLAIWATVNVTAMLGLRLFDLPFLHSQAAAVIILGVAFMVGLQWPRRSTVVTAAVGTFAGFASAWVIVVSLDPRPEGENMLLYWVLFSAIAAAVTLGGTLMAGALSRSRAASYRP